MINKDTVFVLVTDNNYFPKARRTILDLRTKGEWYGEIVCIVIGFNLSDNFKNFYNVTQKSFPLIDKNELLMKLGNGFSEGDGREKTKLNQWEKLQVFDEYFMNWKRVVYLDSGLRVVESVKYLLDLDYKGLFLCPDENYKPEKRIQNVFKSQISNKDTHLKNELINEYGEEILMADNFLNCMWVYDTDLLKTIKKSEFIEIMNKYPLFLTNEMGVMNLLLAMKYKVWKPFPYIIENGKYLFDWCELNRKDTRWTNYCFIKYPVTISPND